MSDRQEVEDQLNEKDAEIDKFKAHIETLEQDKRLLMRALCDCERAENDPLGVPLTIVHSTHDFSCPYRVALREVDDERPRE